MARGYPIHVVILELESGIDGTGHDFWHVEVTTQGSKTECQLTEILGNASDQEEFRWYVEDFASNNGSPFEKARGERCHKRILGLGHLLYYKLGFSSLDIPKDSILNLDIVAKPGESSLFKIPWEVLEHRSLFPHASSICVRRRFADEGTGMPKNILTSALNVLLVTARPKIDQDIDYLLISEEVVNVINKIEDSKLLVNVEIVRPGTWAAFKTTLQRAKEDGNSFHMVHLDLHGLVIETGRNRGAYLSFLHQSGNGPHYRKATEVGKVCKENGVSTVIMNACKSAYSSSPASPVEANIAALLIANGIEMVVGMSFTISQGAAKNFVRSLYSSLFDMGLPLAEATSMARLQLSLDRARNARFGMKVDVDDWVVPTLYMRHSITYEKVREQSDKRTFGNVPNFGASVQRLGSRLRQMLRKEPESYLEIVGRDLDVLRLETTLLLPYRPDSRRSLKRNIIHLTGWPGVGKTALLLYISSWWKRTHFVADAIYCDLDKLNGFHAILTQIQIALFGKSASDTAIDGIREELRRKRYLLIIDHVDVFDPTNKTMLDLLEQLSKFVQSLWGGESFILVSSRNLDGKQTITAEAWPFSLTPLNQHTSVKLVRSRLALTTYENQNIISTREESEALVSLMELCEYIPDCIGSVGDFLVQKNILPTTMLRLQRTGELPSSKISMTTRFGKAMRAFLSAVSSKTDQESKNLLSIVLGLAPFAKRLPLDFEICYVFAKWKGCEGLRDDFRVRLSQSQFLELFTLSNAELASSKWVQDNLGQKDLKVQVTQAIETLTKHNFVWSESFSLESGQNLRYWHIHPLFTFFLRQVVATYYAKAASPAAQKLLRAPYWGLADFYSRRVVEFEDTSMTSVAASRQKLLLELENIINSLDVWLQTDDSSHLPSMILFRLSKTTNMATLGKQEFKKILDVMQRTSERYQRSFLPHVDSRTDLIFQRNQLVNFLQATEVLQNMAMTTEDWTSARKYALLLEQVLLSNTHLLDQYAHVQLRQAKMVLGYEAFERGFITKAKAMFAHNLEVSEPADPKPGIGFAYAKLRFMNSLGMLKSAFQEPPDHPKMLMDLFVQFEKSAFEWHSASESLSFNKGWTEDDKRMMALVEQMKSMLQSVQKIYFEKLPEDKISEFIQSSMSGSMKGSHIRQGALRTMHHSIVEGKIWESASKVAPALLAGLTEAYKDEVDDSGLSRYHKELVAAAIQCDDFETALETLEAWISMRRDEGLPDEHTQAFQDYLYAVCYHGLARYPEAKIYCEKALAMCLQIGADKIRLACLHIAAQLDMFLDVDFGLVVTHLCQAGCLAYSKDNDCQYQKHGSILKILAFAFCIALGLLDEDDYPENLRAKDVKDFFTNAIHGQKGDSKTSSTLNRNTRNTSDQQVKPSQILQYMLEKVRTEVGLLKFINFMTKYNEKVLEAMLAQDESQWARMEALLFGTETDVLAVPGGTTKEPTLGVQSINQQKASPKAGGTSSVTDIPQTMGSEATQQAFQTLNNENVNPETLLPLLGQVLRLVGAFRDAKQRNFLWHLCGAEQADLAEFRELIPQLGALSIPGLNQEVALATIQYFIKSGADIAVFDINGHTPFMRAVETKNLKIASLLLENGAACDHQDFRFETALHQSVNRQDVDAVRYCISAGCSLTTRDIYGKTPLGCAVTHESIEICRLLLGAGSNPIDRDNVGHSVLLQALEAEQHKNFWLCVGAMTRVAAKELREILLDFGHSWSNVNDIILNAQRIDFETLDRLKDILISPDDFARQDMAGITSYHRAVHQRTPEVVKGFFANCGADATIQDDCFGLTPLHVAAISENPWKMREAILNGAGPVDDSIKNCIGGHTPFDLVGYHGEEVTFTVNGSRQRRKQPKKLGFLTRYMLAWATQARKRYVHPLSEDAKTWLIEQQQQVAFAPPAADASNSGRQAMFQSAVMDISYSMTQSINSEAVPGGEPANRLRRFNELLQDDIEKVAEDVQEVRLVFPWKGNCVRWPQVFYLDRNGRCRFTRPLYEIEEKRTCTWVVDEFGAFRGVLGAVDE